MDKTLYTFNYY